MAVKLDTGMSTINCTSIFTNRVNMGGNAITSIHPSVCFHSRIETEGYRLGLGSKTRSVWPQSSIEVSILV